MIYSRLLLIALLVLDVKSQFDYGTECVSPVKCLTPQIFTFCFIVDGKVILQHDTFRCPDNYECVGDPYIPCVEVTSTTTLVTTTTTTTSTVVTSQKSDDEKVTPPSSCTSPGKYPAPTCNEYFECCRVLWWFHMKKKTCPTEQAFDPIKSKCVPLHETNCVI